MPDRRGGIGRSASSESLTAQGSYQRTLNFCVAITRVSSPTNEDECSPVQFVAIRMSGREGVANEGTAAASSNDKPVSFKFLIGACDRARGKAVIRRYLPNGGETFTGKSFTGDDLIK